MSLRGNSGGGEDCCRDHSPKQGQSRSRITGSHGIVKEAVRKWASEVVPIGEGREAKKRIEKEEVKYERSGWGKEERKGVAVSMLSVLVNWELGMCCAGAQGTGLAKTSSNQGARTVSRRCAHPDG